VRYAAAPIILSLSLSLSLFFDVAGAITRSSEFTNTLQKHCQQGCAVLGKRTRADNARLGKLVKHEQARKVVSSSFEAAPVSLVDVSLKEIYTKYACVASNAHHTR
jgi:hypothetical protein